MGGGGACVRREGVVAGGAAAARRGDRGARAPAPHAAAARRCGRRSAAQRRARRGAGAARGARGRRARWVAPLVVDAAPRSSLGDGSRSAGKAANAAGVTLPAARARLRPTSRGPSRGRFAPTRAATAGRRSRCPRGASGARGGQRRGGRGQGVQHGRDAPRARRRSGRGRRRRRRRGAGGKGGVVPRRSRRRSRTTWGCTCT